AREVEIAAIQKELRDTLSQCRWMVLPVRENPSAPAQGALAVEISRRRDDMRELIVPLNCAGTYGAVIHERDILRSYGGGCHQKIGASVLRRPYGDITFLRGVTDDGQILDSGTLCSSRPRPPRISKEELWPISSSDSDWSNRETVSVRPAAGALAF